MAACDQCNRYVKAECLLIECPSCGAACCDDCICGVGVDCFACEEADFEGDQEGGG